MKAKKITAIIEASTTGFGVYSAELPGITGYGKTVEAAKQDILDAIADVLESHEEDGTVAPVELNGGKLLFEFKYDMPSIFNRFDVLNASMFAKKIGMNASLMRQYKSGKAFASAKQKEKIESGLHELGKQLLSVRL